MKKKVAKLSLERETLRRLADKGLANVVGGIGSFTDDRDAGCVPTKVLVISDK